MMAKGIVGSTSRTRGASPMAEIEPPVEKNDSESERRQGGPRVIRHFLVRYRGPNETGWHMSPLRDFSRDGARLVCEESYPPGTALDFRLGLPVFLTPVQITVRVMWQQSVFSGRMQMTEYGISFTELAPAVQQVIDEAVKRFVKLQGAEPAT